MIFLRTKKIIVSRFCCGLISPVISRSYAEKKRGFTESYLFSAGLSEFSVKLCVIASEEVHGYDIFANKKDHCLKVLLRPD